MIEAPPIIEQAARRKFPHRIVWPGVAILLGALSAFIVLFLTRSSSAAAKPVDLSAGYNGSTTDSTNVRNHSRNPDNLEEFPLGENEFGGIRFSVSGVVLLGGRYPDRVERIPLNQRCRRL